MRKSYLLVAGFAVAIMSTAAYSAGYFPGFPILGGASYCQGYANYSTSVTTPGTLPTPNSCVDTVPAGPTVLLGTEQWVADTLYANGVAPQTIYMPVTLFSNAYGGTTIATTTGTTASVVVANAISNYIYAGSSTATYTAISLPPAPIQNQKFCLTNAGSGVLTLTAVNVGTSGQSIVGTTPTSIPVATAVGTAGTVTLSSNCWIYNVSNTSWYRVL